MYINVQMIPICIFLAILPFLLLENPSNSDGYDDNDSYNMLNITCTFLAIYILVYLQTCLTNSISVD